MDEDNLEQWMKVVDRQPFARTDEVKQVIEIVTSLVSRDKLIEWEKFATEQKNKSEDDIFPSVKMYGLVVSVAIFIISLSIPLVTNDDRAASRCMSLLLFTISLWITEAIPYFATALLIPALVTFLGVLKDPSDPTKPMSTDLAASFVLNHIFNHTTVLLLGGYTLSSAFSRCQLELRVASWMQYHVGNSPQLFILAMMFLGLFLSMWISNHTAPILCATIILPVVRDLPSDSRYLAELNTRILSKRCDFHRALVIISLLMIYAFYVWLHRFSKALLLGLAFACNFGGMMTPISSLQNVLAVSYLEQVRCLVATLLDTGDDFKIILYGVVWHYCIVKSGIAISFGHWIAVALPFCTIGVIISWMLIIAIIKPTDITSIPVIVYDTKSFVLGKRNSLVIGCSALTILLFATSSYTMQIFGDIGIISLCFVGFMFGTGILTEVRCFPHLCAVVVIWM